MGNERIGDILAGRYQLRSVLGQGGQGILYRAYDQRQNCDVALKLVRRGGGDPDAITRMFQEADAMTALAGTAAVKVFDHFNQEGDACLVMELLDGRELFDVLADLDKAGGRLSHEQMVEIFEPVVHTLEAARERAIVHRDIKPQNIFVLRGGGVRLLDFGFARFTQKPSFTAAGFVAGSPSYLAPEIWMGKRDLDHRADVYSLGVVLYRVLAGELPFKGGAYELMRQVTGGVRPKLSPLRPDLPSTIDDWVGAALAIDRDLRFARVTALWRALMACTSP